MVRVNFNPNLPYQEHHVCEWNGLYLWQAMVDWNEMINVKNESNNEWFPPVALNHKLCHTQWRFKSKIFGAGF